MAAIGARTPSQAVLDECVNVGVCFAAAGFYEGDPPQISNKGGALLDVLGLEQEMPSHVLGEGPDVDYEEALGNWQYVRNGSPTLVNATFMDKNIARLARRYAKLHNGLIDIGTQQVNQGSDSVRELATEVRNLVQSSTQPAPKVALKETVSQVSEVSATQLTTDELIECYKQWQIVFGKNQRRPPVEQDPSADQLSSINYLLGLKDGSASKIDFAVFGPLQQRLVKRQKLQGVVPNSRGEMVPIELYGPATWAMFKACWAVYQNALVLLKAVDLGNLISYGGFLEDFIKRHGEMAYPLMFQAEHRTRHEQMPRMYTEEVAKYKQAAADNGGTVPADYPFDPDRPLDYLFQLILSEQYQNTWWHRELERPALMLVCKQAKQNDVLAGDAPVGRQAVTPTPPGLDEHVVVADALGASASRGGGGGRPPPPPPPSGGERRKRPPQRHQLDPSGTYYKMSRRGQPICMDYNGSGCGEAVQGNWCPRGHGLHICCRCLQAHPVTECRQNEVRAPNWIERGGKGGKDKGGKGGKGGRGRGGKGGKGGHRPGPYAPQY